MKYRVLTLLGLMALSAATIVQAQDYDDIYYNASSSKSTEGKTVKVVKPAKTIAVYGEVPETYKVVANNNYRVERDVDEYNRRGGEYESNYEVDINGDTIYEEAFANTRRIERFYNPDIVILSDDDDLVELYYDESPSINLIVGSDAFYGSSYGWNWASSYYPWYTMGSYYPWRYSWYDPWYSSFYYGWYRPYYYTSYYWGWGFHHWHNPRWWAGFYGWDNWHYYPHNYADWGHRPRPDRVHGTRGGSTHRNVGLADNRNGRSRVGGGRSAVGSRGDNMGRSSAPSRNRGGIAPSRSSSGNMGSRSSSGVSRSSSVNRSSGISRSSGVSRSSSASRSSGSYNSSSRSSGSYSSGSRSSGGYSSGSSGGSRSSGGGGGSRGGSSGGGGHRR